MFCNYQQFHCNKEGVLSTISQIAHLHPLSLQFPFYDFSLNCNEAVKVFLRALDVVIGEIEKSDWERFDILHRIAHGRERRYGTPLDVIRIECAAFRPLLAKALRRISGQP